MKLLQKVRHRVFEAHCVYNIRILSRDSAYSFKNANNTWRRAISPRQLSCLLSTRVLCVILADIDYSDIV